MSIYLRREDLQFLILVITVPDLEDGVEVLHELMPFVLDLVGLESGVNLGLDHGIQLRQWTVGLTCSLNLLPYR